MKKLFFVVEHFGGLHRAVSQRVGYRYVYRGKLLFPYRIRPYPRIDISDTLLQFLRSQFLNFVRIPKWTIPTPMDAHDDSREPYFQGTIVFGKGSALLNTTTLLLCEKYPFIKLL